jgi:hypothetical protein
LDNIGQEVDTIRLLIPFPVKSKAETVSAPETAAVAAPVEKGTLQDARPPQRSNVAVACMDIATDRDFQRLGRSMAAERNDERMIAHARKSFRVKCFSTEQIRALSALFQTSAAKYQFFDAAYLHVTNRGNFASLASEIKDDYYSRRFKALIGE